MKQKRQTLISPERFPSQTDAHAQILYCGMHIHIYYRIEQNINHCHYRDFLSTIRMSAHCIFVVVVVVVEWNQRILGRRKSKARSSRNEEKCWAWALLTILQLNEIFIKSFCSRFYCRMDPTTTVEPCLLFFYCMYVTW